MEYPLCIIPDAVPRKCAGQCSSVNGIPAAQTPPIPMPNSARHANNIWYELEKPPRNENTEYQTMENINGPLRPQRSAAVPVAMPPATRKIKVTVPSAPASALSTVKLR
jgi:hypothetical protein